MMTNRQLDRLFQTQMYQTFSYFEHVGPSYMKHRVLSQLLQPASAVTAAAGLLTSGCILCLLPSRYDD